MIAFVVLATTAVLDVEPAPSVPSKAYTYCVRKNGEEMERAGESVEFTVKAAFMACRNERADLVRSISFWQSKMKQFSEEYKKQRLQMQVDMTEQPLEAQLNSALMLKRANRK